MEITIPYSQVNLSFESKNGAGEFFAEKVLEPLGIITPGTGSHHLNPNGLFPNHIPNPKDKTTVNNRVHKLQKLLLNFMVVRVGYRWEFYRVVKIYGCYFSCLTAERELLTDPDDIKSKGLTSG